MSDERMGAAWVGSFESLRDYKNIPATTLRDLIHFVLTGKAHGHFIRAVVSNDLTGAFQHGDVDNIKALWAITTWIYNRMPSIARIEPDRWVGLQNFVTGDSAISAEMVADWEKRAVEGTVLG